MKSLMPTVFLMVLLMGITGSNICSHTLSARDIAAWFPAEYFSLPEYDAGKRILYGIQRNGKSRHFASLDFSAKGKTAQIHRRGILPALKGLHKGASALDPKGGRYFFIGAVGNHERPYVSIILDCRTGKVIKSHPLKSLIGVLTFNPLSGTITGMTRADGGGYDWLDMDIQSGKLRVIQSIPRLSRLKSRSGYIDIENKRFLFLGEVDRQTVLVQACLQSGKVLFRNTRNVSIDAYRIQSWNDKSHSLALSTYGVQSCTGIVGYNAEQRTGFIAHLSHTNRHIPQILAKIDRELKGKYGAGLAKTNPIVLGGRRENQQSFRTAVTVYRQLHQVYGLDINGSRTLHLGKSYAVIIDNGRLFIF